MNRQEVIINLGRGELNSGFDSVNVRLKENEIILWEDTCSLGSAPRLKQLLNEWQLLYRATVKLMGDNLSQPVIFDDSAITNVSVQDLSQLHHQLQHELNLWLTVSNFNRVEKQLRTRLNSSAPIIVTILANQATIWQLPWYLWHFFDDYPQAIELFSKPRSVDVTRHQPKRNGQVNIMAVFGEDAALNLQNDRADLRSILGVNNIEFIEQPSAAVISANLTRELGCDIFWFGGHGDSIEGEGIIYLDERTPLEISVLKREFQIAVDRGLQIAVFNCCSGLGLAEQLIDVNIPYIIVMRVEIPNYLAKQFLQDLLIRYRQGADFTQAFKFARHQLSLASSSKFANWLPVLFHNPLSKSVTWQDLKQARAKFPMPRLVVDCCRSISQRSVRSWTAWGLGVVLASFGCVLRYQAPIMVLENTLIDRFQQIQAATTINSDSEVVWVNYDSITIMGRITDPSLLVDTIQRVSQNAPVIAWGIGLRIDSDEFSSLDRLNLVTDCPTNILNSKSMGYLLEQDSCHGSSLASELLIKYQKYRQRLPATLPPGELRLNSNLGIRVKSINFSEVNNLSQSQIKKIFASKVVVIGIDISDARAIDRLLLANSSHHALPLLWPMPLAAEFLWLFLWSTVTIMIIWRIDQRFFIPIVIVIMVSYILMGGMLLASGYSMPVFVTFLVIGSAGIAAFCIYDIAGLIYPDLVRIYYRRGLAKLRSNDRQAAIDDLRAAARLLGEQGKKNQERQMRKRIRDINIKDA
jgi:hypothetical protein